MNARILAAAAMTFVAAAAFGSSPFISNDVKYRDSSLKPATGRSGDASIEALALLGKDGATDLSIAAAGGTIEKVQLKLPGDVTQNFNDVAGTTFNQRLTGLHRGAPVGVQVHVADGTRTGVVSVSESVKLRPDLKIEHASIRPHTAIGVPYTVTALVREANGDTGARASCVLLVDGAEVDRANNIWVDAGGSVTCQLSYLFPAAGTAQVSVALAGASPADFDPANDASAAVPVRVYGSVTELEPWSADAHERTFERRYFSSSPWGQNEQYTSGWSVGMSLFSARYGEHPVNVETLKVSVRTETDGRVLREESDVPFEHSSRFDWDWDTQYDCAFARLDQDHSMFSACRVTSPFFDSYTTISFHHNAGDATYLSRGWYQAYAGNGQYADVHYDNTSRETYGTRFELGDTASFRLQFSDGTNYWEVSPFITLAPHSYRYEQPLTCWGDWCSASLDASTGRLGQDSSANH